MNILPSRNFLKFDNLRVCVTDMSVRELLVLFCMAFILVSAIQTPSVMGEQNTNYGSSKQINLEIKPDGSYRFTSTLYLGKEDISSIFLMMRDENTSVTISSPSKNKIRGDATVEIRFTTMGLSIINEGIKSKIPGKTSDVIPKDYRDAIGLIPGISLDKIDENPIILLYLLEVAKNFGKEPTDIINNEILKKQENKSLEELFGSFNLGSALSFGGFKSFLSNVKIENIRLTEYKWEGTPLKPPNLRIGFSATMSENGGSIEKYRKNLPVSMDISYLITQQGEPRIDLTVDSDAKLPGYKERGTWSIQIPSIAEKVLDKTGVLDNGDNTTFRLKVPEGTELEKLPENYQQTDNTTYVWEGSSGNKALRSVVKENAVSVQMEEKPIQSSPLFWVGIMVIIAIIAILSVKKLGII